MPVPAVPFNQKGVGHSLAKEDREVRSLYIDTIMSDNLKKGLASLLENEVQAQSAIVERGDRSERGMIEHEIAKMLRFLKSVDLENLSQHGAREVLDTYKNHRSALVDVIRGPAGTNQTVVPISVIDSYFDAQADFDWKAKWQDIHQKALEDQPLMATTDSDDTIEAGITPGMLDKSEAVATEDVEAQPAGLRGGPQDGTGPRGDTPACPLTEVEDDIEVEVDVDEGGKSVPELAQGLIDSVTDLDSDGSADGVLSILEDFVVALSDMLDLDVEDADIVEVEVVDVVDDNDIPEGDEEVVVIEPIPVEDEIVEDEIVEDEIVEDEIVEDEIVEDEDNSNDEDTPLNNGEFVEGDEAKKTKKPGVPAQDGSGGGSGQGKEKGEPGVPSGEGPGRDSEECPINDNDDDIDEDEDDIDEDNNNDDKETPSLSEVEVSANKEVKQSNFVEVFPELKGYSLVE